MRSKVYLLSSIQLFLWRSALSMTLCKVYGEEVNDKGISKNQLLGTITLAYFVQRDYWEDCFFTISNSRETTTVHFLKIHLFIYSFLLCCMWTCSYMPWRTDGGQRTTPEESVFWPSKFRGLKSSLQTWGQAWLPAESSRRARFLLKTR